MTDDHEHVHGLAGIVLEFNSATGEVRVGGERVPDELAEDLAGLFRGFRVSAAASEIRRYVTPEIAHHILSAYGDERASMPSLSVAGLISLIRTCSISDDGMLDELNRVEDFHGYVLAVMILAEGVPGSSEPDHGGMRILREIAELDEPAKP